MHKKDSIALVNIDLFYSLSRTLNNKDRISDPLIFLRNV